MSGFKNMVSNDIHKIFLNVDEFAEKRTIRYNGKIYENIPVSLQESLESERENHSEQDHAQGLYRISKTLFCAARDLGGRHLKKDDSIEFISRRNGKNFSEKYTVVSSSCEMGMIEAELEAIKSK